MAGFEVTLHGRFWVITEATELDGSHYSAPIHAPEQRIFSQARKPRGCDSAKLFRLQLHQNPSYTPHESGNGRRRYRSALEC